MEGVAPTNDFDSRASETMLAELNRRRLDFFSLSREELATTLQHRFGVSPYRAQQLFEWVYRQGILDCSVMSNLSKDLRQSMAAAFEFPEASIVDRQISQDGTRKYLFRVSGGAQVETVMIKQPNRMTLCVSSQVGCGMACAFCRTGTMGFIKNLTASEIIQQVRGVIADAKNFGDTFSNIVFMGMGEPLHNLSSVSRAVQILTDVFGFEIAPRRITVSTVGLVPAIRKFGSLNLGVSLAVSLNATTDEVRSQIMPVNKAFPISELVAALKEFPMPPRRRITIEYVMLSGVNDTDADLERLPKIVSKFPSKLNLIPYNENAGLGFRAPTRERVQRWQQVLTSRGIQTTVRWSKGADINAACGQLATGNLEPVLGRSNERYVPVAAD